MSGTRGLTLTVYRTPVYPDCTNGGISSRAAELTLVGVLDERHDRVGRRTNTVEALPRTSRVSEPNEDRPAVALNVRHVDGIALSLHPVEWDDTAGAYVRVLGWFMMGGNYATTSDARLGELVRGITGYRWYGAIAVHDRKEQ